MSKYSLYVSRWMLNAVHINQSCLEISAREHVHLIEQNQHSYYLSYVFCGI